MFYDNKEHKRPHIHAKYGEFVAAFDIETADILAGSLPSRQIRLVQARIEIHRDELNADWQLAIDGHEIFKIEPLK
ncbi:MAG: DUF4160 domain-containing protein [Chlorobium sp.]